MKDKIVGIIGGMGPEATMDLYMKIVKATKVTTEQDHLRVIIDSNPKIPDRTKAILGEGESPLKALVETAKNLEKAGVDQGGISCITAHYFIEDIQKEVSYEILNALEETNEYIKKNYPDSKNIGILATSGTLKADLFKKYFPEYNIMYPKKITQENKVMEAIYGEKGIKQGYVQGEPIRLLIEAAEELIEEGAEIIIGGCTEVSLALDQKDIDKPLIDPMNILAERIAKNE